MAFNFLDVIHHKDFITLLSVVMENYREQDVD